MVIKNIVILLSILFFIGSGLFLIYSATSDSNKILKKFITTSLYVFVPILAVTTILFAMPAKAHAIDDLENHNIKLYLKLNE